MQIKKGFSLIELIIVVLLMAIVYGIYFYTIQNPKKDFKLSAETLKAYLNNKSKEYKKEKLKLICNHEDIVCYLFDKDDKLLESVEFDSSKYTAYTLEKDEHLKPEDYVYREMDNIRYMPTFIYERVDDNLFKPLILFSSDNKWIYFDTYFGNMNEFLNQEELVAYIKKKEYLPMYAGVAIE
jgi:prepilin-type N-terminal cleavage/methylation domain-containing protein